MSKNRFSLITDVHLFLIRDDKILLLLRENTGYMDGYYHVPAGHLEADERIVDALIRESKEEIGIEIKEKDVKFAHIMHNKSDTQRLGFFFEVKKWSGELKNIEPHKCGELKWFSLHNLPEQIVPYAKEAIEFYSENKTISYFGWEQSL